MICNNCGLCCVDYDVIIVDPKAIQKDGIVDLTNVKNYIHKSGYDPCPHLGWKGNTSLCVIHKYDWYKQTPCYQFTQVEDGNQICRLGEHTVKERGEDYYRKYCESWKESHLSGEAFFQKLNGERNKK